jgi:zinc protease
MRAVLRTAAVLVALAACGGGQRAPAHPPNTPPRHTNLGLTIAGFRVSNGLQVVFVPDPRAREVQVTMRYRVGAIDDPPGQEGMAHLVEHLMFLPVVDKQSLFARLEAETTWFNGYTTLDATTYVERAPAKGLEQLLAIEAMRLQVPCSLIGDDLFRREREVVINELSQKDYLLIAEQILNEAVYPEGHPYHRSTAGNDKTLRSITRDQACAFAERHYGLQNAVLVISGNVQEAALKKALEDVLPRIPTRKVDPPTTVPKLTPRAQRVTRSAPIRGRGLLISWPLPSDPSTRAIVLAMKELLAANLNDHVKGSVVVRQLGGDRAPQLVIMIDLGKDGSVDDALAAVRRSIVDLRDRWFAPLEFEHTRQRVTHSLFTKFEDGAQRDVLLARHVEDGRDAGQGFAREVQSTATVTYQMAREIAEDALDLDHAAIVELTPSVAIARGTIEEVGTPIHEAGQPRLASDAAESHHPVSMTNADPLFTVETRELSNGLKVMLMPMSSVPAVEIRLVFAAGTADEPQTKFGAATVAAYGQDLMLTRSDVPWLLAFYAAGGNLSIDVDADHVAYTVSGLDMYVDYLLKGLAHAVRGGNYRNLDKVLELMRKRQKKVKPPELIQAWTNAVYGSSHPYAHSGSGELDLATLDASSVVRFHDDHLTPDNATLIVAGGFDEDIVNAWIDYLFSDWSGHGKPRANGLASVQPAALGKVSDTAQVGLEIVMPAKSGLASRPAQLVIAEMVDELVGDVRYQLGASYGVNARLAESRLAVHYKIIGEIDASRGVDALTLVQQRFEQLRAGTDDLAGVFVRARDRVLAHLAAYSSGSIALANRAERAIDLDRDIRADTMTANAVRKLTLDDIKPSLAEMDLARAAILMRGPRDTMTSMFAALKRTPTIIDK